MTKSEEMGDECQWYMQLSCPFLKELLSLHSSGGLESKTPQDSVLEDQLLP